jgi:hypothetical protein
MPKGGYFKAYVALSAHAGKDAVRPKIPVLFKKYLRFIIILS